MKIEEIYTVLKLQKETFNTLSGVTISDYQTLLSNLDSDSKVSNFNLEIYNQAVTIKYIFDKFEYETNNIENILASSEVMTGNWYREQVLKFQFGDSVQLINNVPSYLEIDEDKQIIEFCSYEEDLDNDQLLLKVRKKEGTKLDFDELSGLEEYIEEVKGIGTKITIINEEPDDIKIYFNVIYDPQFGLENIKTNVESALSNYIENLAFDSKLYMTNITDELQLVDGVTFPRPEKISAKISTQSTYVDYEWEYGLFAGYGVLQDVDLTITYEAK